MKSNRRPLLWALAGGAALALGGLGIWLWRRHRAGQVAEAAAARPEAAPEAPPVEEVAPAVEVPRVDLSTVRHGPAPDLAPKPKPAPTTKPEPAPTVVAVTPPVEPAPLCVVDDLDRDTVQCIEDLVRRHRPRRLWRRELEPETGDELVFLLEAGDEGEWTRVEIVLAAVEGVRGDELDVVPLGSLRPIGIIEDIRVDGCELGQRKTIEREHVALVIKAEPDAPRAVAAKNRRKRYRIQPGGLIEVRPKQIPADGQWACSREDVEIRVIEQNGEHAVLALDGPGGDVNVALLSAGNNGKPRPVASWKFKLAAAASA